MPQKKTEQLLELQLTILAFQWLKLHPELESVTFRRPPQDKKSVEVVKEPAPSRKNKPTK